jgi:molecular chaperone DnaK
VGKEARIQLGFDGVVGRFKREMGTDWKYSFDGNEYSAMELSSEVLKKLYKSATDKLGDISEVVITVPANFSSEARVQTKKAAKLVGIGDVKLTDEPTAAALYYAFEKGGSLNGNYAVYDLGGGTFDISIVNIKGFKVKVLATDGSARLGGVDFDQILQNLVNKKYLEETSEELDEEDFTKTEAEEIKKSLSKRDVRIRLNRKSYLVTQDEFTDAIASSIKKTERVCRSALRDSGLKSSDLKEVFLVGGSTRIPIVQEAVKKVFKIPPTSTINVDEVVALGASIYASLYGKDLTDDQDDATNQIKVQDITPRYFGIIAREFDFKRNKEIEINSIIIPKNTKRPCADTKQYLTTDDNQTGVACKITSSMTESSAPEMSTIIWKGSLGPLPKGRPKGQAIDVTLKFDSDGIMFASFVDISSGIKKNIKLSDIEEN